MNPAAPPEGHTAEVQRHRRKPEFKPAGPASCARPQPGNQHCTFGAGDSDGNAEIFLSATAELLAQFPRPSQAFLCSAGSSGPGSQAQSGNTGPGRFFVRLAGVCSGSVQFGPGLDTCLAGFRWFAQPPNPVLNSRGRFFIGRARSGRPRRGSDGRDRAG